MARVRCDPSTRRSSKYVSAHPSPRAMTRSIRTCRSSTRRWKVISTSEMPGHVGFGEDLLAVAVRVPGPQGVVGADLVAPVEHLLPVGPLRPRRRLDQKAGVAGLAVRRRRLPPGLGLGRQGEEGGEHPVGLVEEVLGQVVGGVHEPGAQAAPDTVDQRPPPGRRPLLEGVQVDVEDLGHRPGPAGPTTAPDSPSGRPAAPEPAGPTPGRDSPSGRPPSADADADAAGATAPRRPVIRPYISGRR